MRFEFHPDALEEYEEAGHHYAAQQPGLDRRFVECVEAAISSIVREPARWRVFSGETRRCLTRVFPYAILYAVEANLVLIVAVAHCSRKPGYWKDRRS